MDVAKLAHLYEIHWLLDICECEMKKWAPLSIDIPRVHLLLFADRYGLKELKVGCISQTKCLKSEMSEIHK